jgi:peptidoglycan/LPS O-acetylase OafA/YrhL
LSYLCAGLALSLLLAWGLHRIVERPLIALGKRLAGSMRRRRAPGAALAQPA